MPIETDRLVLRPYVREDAELLGRAVRESFEHLEPWMPWAKADQSTDDALEVISGIIARWATRTDLTMGMFDRVTGDFRGGTGLHRMDWDARCFEIGYWIHPAHEGKGFVTEAARAPTNFCFDTLAGNRVEIRLDGANVRSRAVPERLGFVHEGTLRANARAVSGELRDTEIYALVRTDDRSAL